MSDLQKYKPKLIDPQPPVPDLALAREHVAAVLGDADAPVLVRMFRGKGETLDAAGPIAEIWPQIEKAQADGFQVYFHPNGYRSGADAKDDPTPGRVLVVDGDDVAKPPEPHEGPAALVWRSDTRWQAAWRLAEPVDADTWRALQASLAAHYGGDVSAANGVGHLFRLGGTLNLKDGKRALYQVKAYPSAAAHSAEHHKALLPVPPERAKPEHERGGDPTCLANLAAALARITLQPGDYATWRDVMFACRSAYVVDADPDAVWSAFDAWSETQPGYDADENLALWDHEEREDGDRIGVGTLFKLAQAGGYTGPVGVYVDHAPPVAPDGYQVGDRFDYQPPAELEPVNGDVKPRYHLFSIAELLAMPLRPFLIPDLIPDGEVAVIYGEAGSGKTWLAVDVVMHVVTGRRWHWEGHSGGPALNAAPVIYFSETPQMLAVKRVAPWCEHYSQDPDTLALHVLQTPPNIEDRGKAMIEAVMASGVRPKVIVLDTVARVMAAAGREEDTRGFGELIDTCDELRRMFRCTVLLIHHTAVNNTSRPRGGGALSAGNGAEVRMVHNTVSRQNLDRGLALISYESGRVQNDERDDTLRTFRAKRVGGGLVLEPIQPAKFAELLPRGQAGAQPGGQKDMSVVRYQIRQAFAYAGDPDELDGTQLKLAWVDADELQRIKAGLVPRTPEQIKNDADGWWKRVRAWVNGHLLDDCLAREPNGEAKRTTLKSPVFICPAEERPEDPAEGTTW